MSYSDKRNMTAKSAGFKAPYRLEPIGFNTRQLGKPPLPPMVALAAAHAFGPGAGR
jgi:hypothetical protein